MFVTIIPKSDITLYFIPEYIISAKNSPINSPTDYQLVESIVLILSGINTESKNICFPILYISRDTKSVQKNLGNIFAIARTKSIEIQYCVKAY